MGRGGIGSGTGGPGPAGPSAQPGRPGPGGAPRQSAGFIPTPTFANNIPKRRALRRRLLELCSEICHDEPGRRAGFIPTPSVANSIPKPASAELPHRRLWEIFRRK